MTCAACSWRSAVSLVASSNFCILLSPCVSCQWHFRASDTLVSSEVYSCHPALKTHIKRDEWAHAPLSTSVNSKITLGLNRMLAGLTESCWFKPKINLALSEVAIIIRQIGWNNLTADHIIYRTSVFFFVFFLKLLHLLFNRKHTFLWWYSCKKYIICTGYLFQMSIFSTFRMWELWESFQRKGIRLGFFLQSFNPIFRPNQQWSDSEVILTLSLSSMVILFIVPTKAANVY